MTIRVLLTRPREDALTLAVMLESKGFSPIIEPVMEIITLPLSELPQTTNGLVLTSKHAARAYAEQASERTIPIYAIGPATAAYARALGFTDVHAAQGSVESLVDMVRTHATPDQSYIYLSGADISQPVEQLLQNYQIPCRRYIAYDARAKSNFSAETQQLLQAGDINAVLFFCRHSANIFIQLLKDMKPTSMEAFCLSKAIADSLSPKDWRAIHTSPTITQEALVMTLLNRYNQCHD